MENYLQQEYFVKFIDIQKYILNYETYAVTLRLPLEDVKILLPEDVDMKRLSRMFWHRTKFSARNELGE